MTPAEQLFFYKDDPGSNPRQTTPEQHHIILDPTSQFVVVPAFGLDELQVFAINGSLIEQRASTKVASGSGPRHGVFWSPNGSKQTENLYFLLLAELTSSLTTYSVSYTENGMNFTEVDVTTSYGNAPVPEGNYAAEIAVSVRRPSLFSRLQSFNIFCCSRITNSLWSRTVTARLSRMTVWTMDQA